MSKMPSLKPREVRKIILKMGFIEDTSKGSHRTYYHPEWDRHTTISFHPGTIPQGTLRAIINQTGLSIDKFLYYRKRRK